MWLWKLISVIFSDFWIMYNLWMDNQCIWGNIFNIVNCYTNLLKNWLKKISDFKSYLVSQVGLSMWLIFKMELFSLYHFLSNDQDERSKGYIDLFETLEIQPDHSWAWSFFHVPNSNPGEPSVHTLWVGAFSWRRKTWCRANTVNSTHQHVCHLLPVPLTVLINFPTLCSGNSH